MPRPARAGRFVLPAILLAVGLVAVATVATPGARAVSYPPLPLASDRLFVNNLSGAEIAPGSGGSLSVRVYDPLPEPMTGVVVAVGVYAFNAFPGNATSGVDVSSAPVLSNATASGLEINESLGTLAPGRAVVLSVPVQSSSSTPAGTFAVRTALRFQENGSNYLLESRGWFSAATWASATGGPGGSTDVNLTALGVSGLLPETSILVQSNDFSDVLWAILGVGIVVVAIGAAIYFRRSNSKSGTRPPPTETQAPRALGKSRTSDGD